MEDNSLSAGKAIFFAIAILALVYLMPALVIVTVLIFATIFGK